MKFIDPYRDEINQNNTLSLLTLLGILFVLSLLMIYLYTFGGNYIGHDSLFHLRRFEVLMDSLHNNQSIIYIDSNSLNGYGYATKWFYPDIILIPFALIGNFTNLDFAYKFMLFVNNMLCGFFMYQLVKRICKNNYAAIIASLLYTFCAYRLIDVFYRDALGETFSFTFLPLILLGLYEIIKGCYKKWYIFTIGYCLLIFSHVLSSFIVSIFVIIILLFHYKAFINNVNRLYSLIISGIAILFIVACFVFPLLEQMMQGPFGYENFGYDNDTIKYNGINQYSLLRGLFSFGPPKPYFVPYQGVLLSVVIALRIFVCKKCIYLKYADIGVLIGVFLLFMSTSLFPWNIFPFNKMNFIQFPWRLLEYSSFLFAFSGGIYLSALFAKPKLKIISLFVLCGLAVLFMIRDSSQFKNGDQLSDYRSIAISDPYFYVGNFDYLPLKASSDSIVNDLNRKAVSLLGHTTVGNLNTHDGTTSVYIEKESEVEDIIKIPLIYYKGYSAELNGVKLPIRESNNGLVEVMVCESGMLNIFYSGTLIQNISMIISLISVICFIIYLIGAKRFKYYNS